MSRPFGAGRAILSGTLVVGVLDGLDALVFTSLRGGRPWRVFQGIASGLLGSASFEGGVPTVLLGVAIHFFIAFAMVATYHAAARRMPVLRGRAVACGAFYGIVTYFFMNAVVIPLTFGWRLPTPVGFINGILAHVFLVGVPSGLFARWGIAETSRGSPRPE